MLSIQKDAETSYSYRSSPTWAATLTGSYLLFSTYSLLAQAPAFPIGACASYTSAVPALETPFIQSIPEPVPPEFLSSAEAEFANFVGTGPCEQYLASLSTSYLIASSQFTSASKIEGPSTVSQTTMATATPITPGPSNSDKIALGVALPLGILLLLAALGIFHLRRYRRRRLNTMAEMREKGSTHSSELGGRARHEIEGRRRQELEAAVGQELEAEGKFGFLGREMGLLAYLGCILGKEGYLLVTFLGSAHSYPYMLHQIA